jgi:hypothetical protein
MHLVLEAVGMVLVVVGVVAAQVTNLLLHTVTARFMVLVEAAVVLVDTRATEALEVTRARFMVLVPQVVVVLVVVDLVELHTMEQGVGVEVESAY